MILGRMLEHSVQQALKTSGADPMIFIEMPISAALLAVGGTVGRCVSNSPLGVEKGSGFTRRGSRIIQRYGHTDEPPATGWPGNPSRNCGARNIVGS